MEGLRRRKLNILPLEKRLMLDASLPVAGAALHLDAADATTILDDDGTDASGNGGDGVFDGFVATWLDKSGNGTDVTAGSSAEPVYNSSGTNNRPALEFDGIDDTLDSGSFTLNTDSLTVFAVAQADNNSNNFQRIFGWQVDADNRFYVQQNGTTNTPNLGVGLQQVNATAVDNQNQNLYTLSWSGGGTPQAFLNGASSGSASTNAAAISGTDSLSVGSRNAGSSNLWDGSIQEIIFYDTALTTTERQQVETYLAGKWGIELASNIPPTVDTNTGASVDEGNTVTVTNTDLASSDHEGALPSDWFDANWQYRNQITIDAANIDSDLTDFTMLIDGSDFGADFWNNVQNDGGDIVITAADGTTKLARELVSIDTSLETMELHAQIPNVSSTVDTDLFIYYGNASANETNDAATWSNGFEGVWHLNEDPNGDPANAIQDSTSNNNDATPNGSMTSSDLVSGQLGNAIDFDGINDNLEIADDPSIGFANTTSTITAWVRPDDLTGWRIVFGDNAEFALAASGNGNERVTGAFYGANTGTQGASLSLNTWQHIGASWNEVTGDYTLFFNGTTVTGNTSNTSAASPNPFVIGDQNPAGSLPFSGLIDEVRFSSLERSVAWIAAEYDNQLNPSGFYNVAAQENAGTPVEYTVSGAVSNGTLFLDANGNDIADGSEVLNVNDTFTQEDIDTNLLKYTHNGGETTADSFGFEISDGTATLTGQTFDFTVNPVNDAPAIIAGSLSTNEGANNTLDLQTLITDAEGVANSDIVVNNDAVNGSLSYNNTTGIVTYTHDGSETTTDSFTYTVDDGTGPQTETITVSITPVNDAPTVDTNTGVGVDEGNTVTVTNTDLASSDPEGALPADWFDADWQYRNQITIDAANIDSDLTDFTMLIDGSDFGADFWSNVQNDGGDIVITTADGTTKLARELVSIDTVAQTMELHAQIPTISSTVDTDLFIYYGNTAANEANDATTTFSNYSHVYHMDNLNAVDVIAANNGTHSNGGSITTGVMGGAHLYTGSGLVDITDISGSNIRTVSFWYNPADRGGGNYGTVLGSNSFNDGIRHVSTNELNVRDAGTVIASTSDTFNTDKHLVFSYDSSSGLLSVFENGTLQDSNAYSGWHDVSYLIGIAGNTSRSPGGMVDEIRISNNVLDIHWAAAEYANQSDPSTFYSVGTQENNTSASVFYTLTANVTNGTLFLDANGNNIADASEILSVNDTFTQDDIDNNLLKYTHDGSSTISDSFNFSLSDGIATLNGQSFAITINPVVTFSDIDNIPNSVLHFDATDLDADGSTADQPADGSTVSQWNDRVGQITNASAGGGERPIYDDNAFSFASGGIVFDGVNDRLFFSSSNEVNRTGYTEKAFAFTFRTSGDVVSDQLIYEQGGGTHGFNFGIFDGNIYAHQYRSGASISYPVDLGAASSNTTYSVIAIFDSGANTWQANINGGAFITIPTSGAMPGHGGGPGFGTESGNTRSPVDGSGISNLHFSGAIGEFWSWNHVLTSTEIAQVDDYLQDKWFDTPHSIGTNTALNVAEDAIVTISNTNLQTIDAEAPDTALVYTLTSLPSQGTLYRSGLALGLSDTFTQDDINNDRISLDHDGTSAPSSDSFDFTVSDGFSADIAGTFNFTIVAAPATDPILTSNNAVTLDEGNNATLSNADLQTEDRDTVTTGLIYEVTSVVSNGTLFNGGATLSVNDTFTQDDINNSLISYTHDDSENFTDSFAFTVTDGTTTLGPASFFFTINPVNDQTPTDIALSSTSVNENSSNGTVIGTLSASDPDLPGDSFTYSVVSDPDNKFQIVGNQLRVNGSLDRETDTNHNVTIRVSDGAFTYDESFTINVNDVNENPTDITLSQTSIVENSAIGTVIGTLGASDPDLPGDSLTFSVFADPDNKFQIVGNELRVNGTLDIEAQASHNVTVRVADGNGGTYNEAFTITLTDLNDIPIITSGEGRLSQGETLTLTTAMLSATDQDNVDGGLIYELTSLPTDGILALNGSALSVFDTFSQQDIIDGRVTYAHDNTATVTSDSFSFTVTDGALTTTPSTLNLYLDVYRDTNTAQTIAEGNDAAISDTNLFYDASWFDNDWSYRQLITVDSAQIDSDLTDFPLLITENGLDANFWANVQNDGSDIVVTDSQGSRLDRELVSIDTIGQTLQLYARTDLSASIDTELYLYYGNATASETNAATTWRSEYTGVWHFDDDFNDGDAADSSQSGHDGFANNGFNNTNSTVGVTGNAAQFNDSEYLALNYSYSGNNVLPQISVSAWVNTTVNSGGQSDNWAIIDFDRSEVFNVFVHGNGTVGFSTSGSGFATNDQTTAVTVNDGTWHHITAVYDGTDKILYVDGIEADRVVNAHGGTALGQSTRFGYIGQNSEGTAFNAQTTGPYYDGLYDNIRIYEGTKDAAWIAAEYRNTHNPAAFYSVGAETDRTPLTTYVVESLPLNGSLYFDTNLNGVLDGGEELGINDTFTQHNINNNFLRYAHNGGETTSDSFDFTVQNMMGGSTALQTFNVIISTVNDSPTDIVISNSAIDENSDTGTAIGTLTTDDVDVPSDSFTYTILDDPDNKFAINGDRLVVNGALDFENTQSHTVTIRTDDNNGGTFDQTFTIDVTNLADDTVIMQSDDNRLQPANAIQTGRIGGFDGLSSLEELENTATKDSIIMASLTGEAEQMAAFYGAEDSLQILREKTTLDIAQSREDSATSGAANLSSQNAISSPDITASEEPAQAETNPHYTNLREALVFLQQLETQNSTDDNANAPPEDSQGIRSKLDQQFRDVLTYHQQRQNALRDALLRSD